MCVGTTEAAYLLGISTRRLRHLLAQGRVRGAHKSVSIWIIPLFNGIPVIVKSRGGPAGTWRKRRQPALTRIKVNRPNIKANEKKPKSERIPVISVMKRQENRYGYEAELTGPSRIVYRPERPLSCGATLWIETLDEVFVIPSLHQNFGSFPCCANTG
jgi:hypothetical protein